MKKRGIFLLLVFSVLVSSLSACTAGGDTADYDLELLAEEIMAAGVFSDILTKVSPEIAESLYGYEDIDITELVLYCSTGATTEEIGLFKCGDENSAAIILEKAKVRLTSQYNIYESYAPAEMPKLNNAVCKAEGNYVFYIVSIDSAAVMRVLEAKE